MFKMLHRNALRHSIRDVIKFNLSLMFRNDMISGTNERANLFINAPSRYCLFNRFCRRVFDGNALNATQHALISTRTCKEGSNSRAMSLTLTDSPSTFDPRRSLNKVLYPFYRECDKTRRTCLWNTRNRYSKSLEIKIKQAPLSKGR